MLPDSAKLDDAGIAATFSTILAVKTDQLPEGKDMTSWADIWDVETFPGARGAVRDDGAFSQHGERALRPR